MFLFIMQEAMENLDRVWSEHNIEAPSFSWDPDGNGSSINGTITGWHTLRTGTVFKFFSALYADDGAFMLSSRDSMTNGTIQASIQKEYGATDTNISYYINQTNTTVINITTPTNKQNAVFEAVSAPSKTPTPDIPSHAAASSQPSHTTAEFTFTQRTPK